MPLGFLAFWLLLLYVNRGAVTDPETYLRDVAKRRSVSRIVRALGGSADPNVEFPGLWKQRWLEPIIWLLTLGIVVTMLVVSIIQR